MEDAVQGGLLQCVRQADVRLVENHPHQLLAIVYFDILDDPLVQRLYLWRHILGEEEGGNLATTADEGLDMWVGRTVVKEQDGPGLKLLAAMVLYDLWYKLRLEPGFEHSWSHPGIARVGLLHWEGVGIDVVKALWVLEAAYHQGLQLVRADLVSGQQESHLIFALLEALSIGGRVGEGKGLVG